MTTHSLAPVGAAAYSQGREPNATYFGDFVCILAGLRGRGSKQCGMEPLAKVSGIGLTLA